MPEEKIITKICLCGSGAGALAAINGLGASHDIVVVSNDLAVQERAIDLGFRCTDDLLFVEASIYICAGYPKILEKKFLDNKQVLNIHYSLLPKYRGFHSIIWAILNDEPFFGLTIHVVNENIDDGPILYQHSFSNTGQTSHEVIQMCHAHLEENLFAILKDIQDGALKPVPQDKSKATWVCKRNLDDCIIDFDQKNHDLKLFFRALVDPYPLPRIKTQSCEIEIVQSELLDLNYYMQNGRVVNIEDGKVWIKVQEGLLVISEIRDSKTKAPLKIQEMFKIGQRLK